MLDLFDVNQWVFQADLGKWMVGFKQRSTVLLKDYDVDRHHQGAIIVPFEILFSNDLPV